MIDIYIKGKRADYFGSLTIKKDNPMFSNFDVEPTEHTYTLTLPTTATNVQIFSFLQYTLAKPATLPARIEIDGIPMLEGSCNVQSWDDSGYSVYFSGVIPYEDTADNPIKRMLADERLMNVIFANHKEWTNITNPDKWGDGVLWEGENIITKTTSKGVVDMFAYRQFYYAHTDGVASLSWNPTIGFSIGVMLGLIEKYYRITFNGDFSALKDCFTVTNTLGYKYPTTTIDTPAYIANRLPKLTIKQYLQGISAMIGCRLKYSFETNIISFVNLNNIKKATHLEALNYELDWSSAIGVIGGVEFKNILPMTEKKTENVDGVEMEIETEHPLSVELSTTINNEDKKLYTIPFANPQSKDGIIILSYDYFKDKKPVKLKEEQLGYSVIAMVNEQLNVPNSNNKGCFIPPSQGIIGKSQFDEKFQIWKNASSRHTTIKLRSRINPVQFSQLDMWSPIHVDNIGNVFIKSINFKSDGESDIEAYLY